MTLRCTYCRYTVPGWERSQAGQPINGHALLRAHVRAEHPREYATIRTTFGQMTGNALCWLIIVANCLYWLGEGVRAWLH